MPTFILGIEVHPACEAWSSVMDDKRLHEMAKDIRANGVREPITMCEGKLLDGRNRMRAAAIAEIPVGRIPKRELPTGQNPYLAVASLNGHRLHLSPGERARNLVSVLKAAGELDRMRVEAAFRKTTDNRPLSRSLSIDNEQKRPGKVHEQVAAAVEVSPSTALKALTAIEHPERAKPKNYATVDFPVDEEPAAEESTEPSRKPPQRDWSKTKQGTMWRVPRSPKQLAAFLRERWTTAEWRTFSRAVADLTSRCA